MSGPARLTEEMWFSDEDELITRYLEYMKWDKSMVLDRKLRLLACACLRQIPEGMSVPVYRHAVETTELFIDGGTNVEAVRQAHQQATEFREPGERQLLQSAFRPTGKEAGRQWRKITLRRGEFAAVAKLAEHPLSHCWKTIDSPEKVEQRNDLFRDVFPNPFRPAPIVDPCWLAWNGGTVKRLAQAIYDARTFEDLPILADALEDAGCDDVEMLDHCRGPGPHVRGCWVVDALLNKPWGREEKRVAVAG